MQTKALNTKNKNWKQIKDSAYSKANGAVSYKEAFPALLMPFSNERITIV